MSTYDYVLKLTDGTTNVTLTSTPFNVREYQPRAGRHDDAQVAETIEVRITDGSVPNNLAELRVINRLLTQAAERQKNRTLPKVYLTFKESASGSEYRSEIYQGRAEWNSSAMDRSYWAEDLQFARVYIERANWWEGPEAQVPLSNGNGTANITGLNVYNYNDGTGSSPNKRHNYVDIAAASVAGDLPAATRLELSNTYNVDSRQLRDVWIGQSCLNHSTLAHWLPSVEGEVTLSLADNPYTVETWALATAQIDAAAGRQFKILVCFASSANTNCRYQVEIRRGALVLWSSAWFQLGTDRTMLIHDLLSLHLPPWLQGMTGLADLDLRIRAQAKTVPQIISLTYIQLTPLDGWRHLTVGTCDYLRRLVDDGIEDRLYTDDGAGVVKEGSYAGLGEAIMLRPGIDQRLIFLQHTTVFNAAYPDQTLSVKLFYRPRRWSL
jgi:hypothetical protein